jgi:hypothetical protein
MLPGKFGCTDIDHSIGLLFGQVCETFGHGIRRPGCHQYYN